MQETFAPKILLCDRYEIQQVIAQTATESTYIATDQTLSKVCLLHEIIAQDCQSLRSVISQYEPQLNQLKSIRHPQIQHVEDFFEQDTSFYFVQEHFQGENYQDILQQKGAFSEAETTEFLQQVLPLLSYLHRQSISHENIAPESFILDTHANKPILTNFGIIQKIKANLLGAASANHLNSQLRQLPIGMLPAAQEGDLFLLGVTTALLLTGQSLPALFNVQTLSWDWEQWKLVSDQLAQVLNQLLGMVPGQRFTNADMALHVLVAPTSVPTMPAAPPAPVPTPTQYPYPQAPAPSYPSNTVPQPTAVTSPSSQKADKKWLFALAGGIGVAVLGILIAIPTLIHQAPRTANTEQANTDESVRSSNSEQFDTRQDSPDIPAFTEVEAVQLIEDWMVTKQKIFASPYDRNLAEQYTTGNLYYDITKPGGSIDWLQENNAYYSFRSQRVSNPKNFTKTDSRATIEVDITEDRTFYVNGRVDRTQTEFDTNTIRYEFQLNEQNWQIADYSNVSNKER